LQSSAFANDDGVDILTVLSPVFGQSCWAWDGLDWLGFRP
jgi:hypothetical protein